MGCIEITNGANYKRHFRYLEDVAQYLETWYGREVLVSDIENQIDSKCCDFIVFGDKYHWELKED